MTDPIEATLVTYDEVGAYLSRRKTTENEIVEIHYEQSEDEVPVYNVEVTPYPTAGGSIRVNLNDGVALLFDNKDDMDIFLDSVRDMVYEEYARRVTSRRRDEPECEELPF